MVKGALKKLMATSCPHPDPMNFVSLDLGVTSVLDVADECLSLPLRLRQKDRGGGELFLFGEEPEQAEIPKRRRSESLA
jgi:hypothetical protein